MNKYQLNPQYNEYKDFLLNIKQYFKTNTSSIHKARNEIKIIEYNNTKFVVKSFKKLSGLKAYYYTKNSSKAQRSYEYGLKLDNLTPTPVGYIEFFENGYLSESFFISEYFEYDFTIKEPLRDIKFKNREKILQEFANFTYQLHQKNILHLDYSAGNILIKEFNSEYIFKVVDLNRMKFKPLSINERLQNFNMLWPSNEAITIIAKQYAKVANIPEQIAIKKAISYAFKLKLFKNSKKLLKGKIKNIDW